MSKILLSAIILLATSLASARTCADFAGTYDAVTKATRVENPKPSDWEITHHSKFTIAQANCSYLETQTAPPFESTYGFIINSKFNEVNGVDADRLIARANWHGPNELFVATQQFTGSTSTGWYLVWSTNQALYVDRGTLIWEIKTYGPQGRFEKQQVHTLTRR